MKQKNDQSLNDWVDALQAKGRYFFTRTEARSTLTMSDAALERAIGRLCAKKRLARIYRGFFVLVPLEYSVPGIVPADWFVHDLMQYLQLPYYAGVLTAAAYHGASHQAVQTFHVVTTDSIRDISCRGVRVRFFKKRTVAATPCVRLNTTTGYLSVSTPEATAFDLLRFSRRIGGLNHVLTVMQELGEKIDGDKFVRQAKQDGEQAYAQRLGWLLDQTDFAASANGLAAWVQRKQPATVRLDPALPVRGSKRDRKWKLWLNIEVEGDLA